PAEDTPLSTRDHYALIGVSRESSTHEIRDAYWRQVRTYSTGLEHGDRVRELREAYETLTDPFRRAQYDLGGDGAGSAAAGPEPPAPAAAIATATDTPRPPASRA